MRRGYGIAGLATVSVLGMTCPNEDVFGFFLLQLKHIINLAYMLIGFCAFASQGAPGPASHMISVIVAPLYVTEPFASHTKGTLG